MNYYERIQYNTNFFSLLDYDKNKTNNIKDDVIKQGCSTPGPRITLWPVKEF